MPAGGPSVNAEPTPPSPRPVPGTTPGASPFPPVVRAASLTRTRRPSPPRATGPPPAQDR